MRKLFIIVASLFFISMANAQNNVNLIPYPQKIEIADTHFAFGKKIQLVNENIELFKSEASYLKEVLNESNIEVTTKKAKQKINLVQNSNLATEGYSLQIIPDAITIEASTSAGMFYGIETLNQLIQLNKHKDKALIIPSLTIQDAPSFEWRGSHIDVARHFFTTDYIKKHIDRLAFYKMNKLHMHLTDDEGWRIEIKKYPELTKQGAFRSFDKHDRQCIEMSANNPDMAIDSRFIETLPNGETQYGGYYTQEELKDIIDYATKKHIEIIPEIDMPGHMSAAINAYPELIEGEGGWGQVFSTPICVCKESVYDFLGDILEEVIDIFPSKYIHIGADEVEKTSWTNSELCKELMEKEGLKNVNELQSYFVHRMQDFVESKGKKLIGWDEVLDGGVNPDITVMYWRGWAPNSPQKATLNGSEVIMTPNNPLYFDYEPNESSLRSVYDLKVIYDNVEKGKEHLIKGAQANLWTETIPSENRADYMLFPRLIALADKVWTNGNDFEAFNERVNSHFPLMDNFDIAYRMPDICGVVGESVFVDDTVLKLESPIAGAKIHYTTDGSAPDKSSPIIPDEGLEINKPMLVKLSLLGENKGKGKIYSVNFTPTTYAKPVLTRQMFYPGLQCEYYDLPIDKTTKIEGEPTKTLVVKNVTVPSEANAPQFGLQFNGYIDVPETGIYSFYLTCDDAGMLYVADRLVIDNEGPHSPVLKSGQVALEKGLHPFHLDFVEAGGGYTLILQYTFGNDCKPKDIPDSWFKY